MRVRALTWTQRDGKIQALVDTQSPVALSERLQLHRRTWPEDNAEIGDFYLVPVRDTQLDGCALALGTDPIPEVE